MSEEIIHEETIHLLLEYIKKHHWVGYVGLAVILVVALQLIIGGLIDLNILSVNEAFEKFI